MFLLLKGELEGRFDPLFYSENIFRFLKTTPFEVKKIREIQTFVKSGFGAGKQDQDLNQNGYIQIRPTNLDENGVMYLGFPWKLIRAFIFLKEPQP